MHDAIELQLHSRHRLSGNLRPEHPLDVTASCGSVTFTHSNSRYPRATFFHLPVDDIFDVELRLRLARQLYGERGPSDFEHAGSGRQHIDRLEHRRLRMERSKESVPASFSFPAHLNE